MGFGPTGIYTHDGTSPASIRVATSSLELSLRTKVVTAFANTTARDAAFAGLSSGAKEGILCWIVNRSGHSYWDPTGNTWQWMGVNRGLYDGTRPSAAETSGPGGAGTSIILTPTIALPPGNRLIEVSAVSTVTNIGVTTNGKLPRIYVGASGIRDQRYLPPGTTDITMRIDGATFVASGAVDLDLRGMNITAEAVRFTGSTLRIIDRGPTDS